jgi:hypothetical protein
MTRYLILAALAAVSLPCAAQVRTLEPGDEVRVHAPALHAGPFRAQVVSYYGDTLRVRQQASDSVLALPMESIRRLARNEGMQRGRSFRHGLRVGAFLGGSTGAVMGPMIARTRDEDRFLQTCLVSTGVGVVGGTLIGGLLGVVFPREHWQRYGMTARPVAPPPPLAQQQVTAPPAQ